MAREVRPHLSGVDSLFGSLSFAGEARAYLWPPPTHEYLIDSLLVFAESQPRSYLLRHSGSNQQSVSSRLSTPHFAHPSNESSLLQDDCTRSASHLQLIPSNRSTSSVTTASPNPGNKMKKTPPDRPCFFEWEQTLMVSSATPLECFCIVGGFFPLCRYDTNARNRSYVLSRFSPPPPPPIERISSFDIMSTFSLIPQHSFP